MNLENPKVLFDGIVKGNYHKGGIKCLKLFRVREPFFSQVRKEAIELVSSLKPSLVTEYSHVTNWTKPVGTAAQYSLLNRSGRLDDTSVDHNLSVLDKKFHFASQYPALGEFISTFKHAINMRLNLLERKSALSPHEEHIVHRDKTGKFFLRTRFHLPLFTNLKAEMLLDNEIFHFEEGYIYFFNNGTIHSATNFSPEKRYHFVWDMLLTKESYDLMFNPSGAGPEHFERISGDEQLIFPLRKTDIKEYRVSGIGSSIYKRLKLERIGIQPHKFQNFYNNLEYLYPKKIDFANVR